MSVMGPDLLTLISVEYLYEAQHNSRTLKWYSSGSFRRLLPVTWSCFLAARKFSNLEAGPVKEGDTFVVSNSVT